MSKTRRIPRTIKEEREVRIQADRIQWRYIRELQREVSRLHEMVADLELALSHQQPQATQGDEVTITFRRA